MFLFGWGGNPWASRFFGSHRTGPHNDTVDSVYQNRKTALILFGGGFLAVFAERFAQAALEGFGEGIGFAALIDLDRLAGRIEDHPAVGALRDVLLKLLAGRQLDLAVQVVGDFA